MNTLASRVVLVGKGPPEHGGIPTFIKTLLASTLADRRDLVLVNLTRREVSGERKLTGQNLRRAAEDAVAVWREARDGEIVHVHSALASHMVVARAGLLAAAGRLRGARVVVHAHSGRVEHWFTTPLRRTLGRVMLSSAHRVIAVAEGGRRVLSDTLGASRVELIEYGIDTAAFGHPTHRNDPPRVLFAGVLTPRKGVIDLLNASARLHDRGVPHELWLAGGTPEEGPAAEAAVRAASSPDVKWLGQQPNDRMPEIYRNVDVFCLPSWGEALPLSVMEAMASRLPVVASRVGDIHREVVDGVTGRLVPPRDPDALADALELLLRDQQLRQSMGAAGRERVVERYDVATVVAALEALYAKLDVTAA